MRIVVALPLLLVLAGAAHATPCVTDTICADGDLCDGIERCVGGECVTGLPLVCDDGDPCTRDLCEPTIGCAHVEDACPSSCVGLPDGTRCADGTVCTRGDACAGEVCVPGPTIDCDDGDPCTRDACDATHGCVYTEEAVSPPCHDSCAGVVADYTPCVGDGNICTLDGCLPSVDLLGDPHMCVIGLRGLQRQCDDGDFCNGLEFCSPTLGCQPGPPPVCDDGLVCNGVETCDSALGCLPGTPEPDGTGCDDGRGCTTADACSAGVCVGTPLTPADCDDGDGSTDDVCEEGFGCIHCVAARLGLLRVRHGRHGDSIKVRGELDAGGAIAPATEPVSLLVESGGAMLFQATLAAGALVPNPGATRFAYRDRDGTNGPVRLLRVLARNGAVKWSAQAAGVPIATAGAADVSARLLVGDACLLGTAPCVGTAATLTCR